MGPSDSSCPIDLHQMFKPSRCVLPQKIETLAATIVDSIGLEMPPMNFFEIARRYIRQLKLPYEKILPKAMLIYEWSLSPGLWLSRNQSRFPTRLCVLSIIIVAIRMLYNINGFGFWERSLSNNAAPSDSRDKKKCLMDLNLERDQLEEEAAKLLCHLHSLYTGVPKQYELDVFGYVESEYAKDLQTYLKHCEDFVFARLEPPFEDYKENMMVKDGEVSKVSEPKTDEQKFAGIEENQALKILKLDMQEKGFNYLPPRIKPRKFNYIYYGRKKDDGILAYIAHADYYILLRACA
ncbi:TATA box-binding protein-associated factor RNA polymerase I subunit B-like [Neltuma alba]|uniref:TATA box-binding protein-associated factor RNA polymerase I subunit B-like n=1 Tax=Neltuma alba TaxID=207710 RepID=UPI0010A3BE25|nr:TATA box-binding protein-associated factor RNA polymerase I subunit B-like [Prosopis alba]